MATSRFIRLCSGRVSPCNRPILSPQAIGYPRSPVDDLLAFHIVFGKTRRRHFAQRDRQSRLCRLPLPRARLSRRHAVGVFAKSSGSRKIPIGESGVVYVRTRGFNQHGVEIVDYVRWVMVRKRDAASPAPAPVVPELAKALPADSLGDACPGPRQSRAMILRSPARRIAGAIMPSARKSIMSTA